MRIFLFLAVVANSLDLLLTALGIHWLGNREGNPLLAGMASHQWLLFVLVKGVLVPILIWKLYQYRRSTPVLANLGMVIVVLALTIALGQWLGWMAGKLHVASMTGL